MSDIVERLRQGVKVTYHLDSFEVIHYQAEAADTIEALYDGLADANSHANQLERGLDKSIEQLAAMTAERDEFMESARNGTVVAAQLTTQLEALRRELAEAKMIATNGLKYVEQLAASQAREQQLRGALRELLNHPVGNNPANEIREALALPSDDTAFKQYGAKLLRDAANTAEQHIDYPTDTEDIAFNGKLSFLALHLRRMADELEQKK